jgi:hypothetical protein
MARFVWARIDQSVNQFRNGQWSQEVTQSMCNIQNWLYRMIVQADLCHTDDEGLVSKDSIRGRGLDGKLSKYTDLIPYAGPGPAETKADEYMKGLREAVQSEFYSSGEYLAEDVWGDLDKAPYDRTFDFGQGNALNLKTYLNRVVAAIRHVRIDMMFDKENAVDREMKRKTGALKGLSCTSFRDPQDVPRASLYLANIEYPSRSATEDEATEIMYQLRKEVRIDPAGVSEPIFYPVAGICNPSGTLPKERMVMVNMLTDVAGEVELYNKDGDTSPIKFELERCYHLKGLQMSNDQTIPVLEMVGQSHDIYNITEGQVIGVSSVRKGSGQLDCQTLVLNSGGRCLCLKSTGGSPIDADWLRIGLNSEDDLAHGDLPDLDPFNYMRLIQKCNRPMDFSEGKMYVIKLRSGTLDIVIPRIARFLNRKGRLSWRIKGTNERQIIRIMRALLRKGDDRTTRLGIKKAW